MPQRRARSSQQGISNSVLHRLYAEPLCLRDAIGRLLPGEQDVQQRLVRPGDTRSYSRTFLDRTMVCFPSPPPAQQQPLRLSQRCTMEQVGSAHVPPLCHPLCTPCCRARPGSLMQLSRLGAAAAGGAAGHRVAGRQQRQQRAARRVPPGGRRCSRCSSSALILHQHAVCRRARSATRMHGQPVGAAASVRRQAAAAAASFLGCTQHSSSTPALPRRCCWAPSGGSCWVASVMRCCWRCCCTAACLRRWLVTASCSSAAAPSARCEAAAAGVHVHVGIENWRNHLTQPATAAAAAKDSWCVTGPACRSCSCHQMIGCCSQQMEAGQQQQRRLQQPHKQLQPQRGSRLLQRRALQHQGRVAALLERAADTMAQLLVAGRPWTGHSSSKRSRCRARQAMQLMVVRRSMGVAGLAAGSGASSGRSSSSSGVRVQQLLARQQTVTCWMQLMK